MKYHCTCDSSDCAGVVAVVDFVCGEIFTNFAGLGGGKCCFMV